MEAFGIITFVLVIYIICTMPTKKELRRIARPEFEERRRAGLRNLLHERVGSVCALDPA